MDRLSIEFLLRKGSDHGASSGDLDLVGQASFSEKIARRGSDGGFARTNIDDNDSPHRSSIFKLLNDDDTSEDPLQRPFRSAPPSPDRSALAINSITTNTKYSKSFDTLPSYNSSQRNSIQQFSSNVKKVPSMSSTISKKNTPMTVNSWLQALRAQTYCNILSDSDSLVDQEKKFRCPFIKSCDKRIKGKGNLRRHVEWHLKRIEGEYKGRELANETVTFVDFESIFEDKEENNSNNSSRSAKSNSHAHSKGHEHSHRRSSSESFNTKSNSNKASAASVPPLVYNLQFYQQLQLPPSYNSNNNNSSNQQRQIAPPAYRPLKSLPFPNSIIP